MNHPTFPHLFSPIGIRGKEIRNRIFVLAQGTAAGLPFTTSSKESGGAAFTSSAMPSRRAPPKWPSWRASRP